MDPQDKYHKCVNILSEIHDVIYVMIQTGVSEEMTAYGLIEEAFEVLRQIDEHKPMKTAPIEKTVDKKQKKLLH